LVLLFFFFFFFFSGASKMIYINRQSQNTVC
jgi:hypothetical protein